MKNETEKTYEQIEAEFAAIDWFAVGKEDAEDRLPYCVDSEGNTAGYLGADSTPWNDEHPSQAQEYLEAGDEWELSEEEEKRREELIEAARDSYNEGWYEAEAAILKAEAVEYEQRLAKAGEFGWRVCVFGLPGTGDHRHEVAAPGEANEVSERLFQPGPCGPYDSFILTPAEAAAATWQDGTSIYGAAVEEILRRSGV